MNRVLFDSPVGKLLLSEDNGRLIGVSFFDGKPDFSQRESRTLLETEMQLTEYFSGKRKEFSLPLMPYGTSFHLSVWEELRRTPYGETRTYAQIASAIGNGKAARAIGLACHSNPIAIIIPCHRIIGTNKELVGYSAGVERKRRLLLLEGISL